MASNTKDGTQQPTPGTQKISVGGNGMKKAPPRPQQSRPQHSAAENDELPNISDEAFNRILQLKMQQMGQGGSSGQFIVDAPTHTRVKNAPGGVVASCVSCIQKDLAEQQELIVQLKNKLEAIGMYDYGKIETPSENNDSSFTGKLNNIESRVKVNNHVLSILNEHLAHLFSE